MTRTVGHGESERGRAEGQAGEARAGEARAAVEPAPARPAGPPADGSAGAPAEFVDDLRQLRRLVTKSGRKGLADLVGRPGG